MHQLKLYACIALIILGFSEVSAQTVIGGDTIDQSAILDIQDTAKGVLLPKADLCAAQCHCQSC
jgi:hypothetical protein